jgi:T5SS/PEP-CTERM-associated repeat protein
MQLIQCGKRLFTIGPPRRALWSFRAIAAAGVLIASIAQTESRAAIILVDLNGHTLVKGNLASGPPNQPVDVVNGYNVLQFVPDGFGSFTLDGTPPPGTTTIPGASAVANTHLEATITSQGDTLSVSSNASASAVVSGSRTAERVAGGAAEGNGQFGLAFITDRPSEYVITSQPSASFVAIPEFAHRVRVDARFQLFGTGGFLHRVLQNNGVVETIVQGSSVGPLEPGTHEFFAAFQASVDSSAGTSANASYNFTFRVTPASRWIDPGGGSFQAADNWFAPIVPGAPDVAIFDLPGTYTVTLEQDVTNKRLRANGAGVGVSFDLNGNEYVLDEISVGGRDGDNVSVAFGDSNPPVVVVAAAFASGGPAGAAANGSAEPRLWSRLLKAGKGGTANVTIPISTTLGTIDFEGLVKVTGTKARWDVVLLTLGADDIGKLEISAGGKVVSERAVLGENPSVGDINVATVTGQDSTWESQTLVVGERGLGLLKIEDKGLVTGRDIVIGSAAGSGGAILVRNSASLLQNSTDNLTIAVAGAGSLQVESGSRVAAGNLFMGGSSAVEGVAIVGSGGLLEVVGSLSVGANARLVVDGGRVERKQLAGAANFTSIGLNGELRVNAGHFNERSLLKVNGLMNINPTLGSASIGVNTVQSPGVLTVGPGGTLRGIGTIRGKVDVLGGSDEFGGLVSVGNSPGTLTIDGDYEQTGGTLGIEIAGTAPGQFSVLAVTGNASLAGALLLEFINGFAPRQGDVFEFLDVGGALAGSFANVELRNLAPGFQFDLRPEAGGLTMVALNDGVFVPEPATLAMLVAGMLATLFRRQARRSQ